MKPLLSIKANVDVFAGQPLDNIITGLVRRKATGIALAHPFWLLCGVFLFCGRGAVGTTALAIRTPSILVVGADSLESRGDGVRLGNVCKIVKHGNFYASFAGISNDSVTGFDVRAIATHAMENCATLDCAVSNFTREVKVPLIKSLVDSRQRGEAYFAEAFLKRAPLQALIFGRQGDSTVLRMVVFNVDKAKREMDLTVDDDGGCPGTCGPQGISLNGIGSYFIAVEMFGNFLRASPSANNSPVNVIIKALSAEARANPKAVAAPFSILILDGAGDRWQNGYQGACPDIGK